MNDRARAVALLKQARDLLAAQLTEQVLENAEGVLDDASGDSYRGDIEGLYEKFGARLSHINQILQHLPPLAEEAAEVVAPFVPPAAAHLPLGLPAPKGRALAPLNEGVLTLPPSSVADAPSATLIHDVTSPPVSLSGFLAQARAGDVIAAAQSLAWLCELDAERALDGARTFSDRLADDPHFAEKIPALQRLLASDNLGGALLLLGECFGFVGNESLAVLQTLRLRWEQ